MFKIYIDGDAFPNLLKPIIFRAIQRLNIQTFVVANKKISIGEKSKLIEYIIVEDGADIADDKIAQMVQNADLVITADIPLADRVISKNAHAIDHRGELYTKDNIKQYLSIRNFMEKVRESGEITKGPKPFSNKDTHKFANTLNSFLNKRITTNL